MAPEHPFPAAVDDCLAATLHFMENAKKYNVNKDRIAIGGNDILCCLMYSLFEIFKQELCKMAKSVLIRGFK